MESENDILALPWDKFRFLVCAEMKREELTSR
jgi:hypothetical protein